MTDDLDTLVFPGDWADQALCAQTDPDLFFPDQGQPSAPAKAICRTCPVRAECLDHTLAARPRFGVWAGLTAAQIRRLARDAA